MTVQIDMGQMEDGEIAVLDLEELLATRLLVQGNSGSGKSFLLRRMLEQSAPWVQQIIIDPEGDFVTLAEEYGHLVINVFEEQHTDHSLLNGAMQAREHRVSVVLNLENLDAEDQMRSAAVFLNGLFDADRAHWYAALIVVDEAQLFAPTTSGDVSEDVRKLSLGAMTNLMCRGRKRGLAGIIATQRLAKLAKNVAAEASNFLMGRTFLDIDMARAADLLGLTKQQSEMFRDLPRGNFIALGPAMSRRPLRITIGPVKTVARGVTPKLTPLPGQPADAVREQILKRPDVVDASQITPRRSAGAGPTDMLAELSRFARSRESTAAVAERVEVSEEEQAERHSKICGIVREIASDPQASFRQAGVLYQDFTARCRIQGLGKPIEINKFTRLLASARSGIAQDVENGEDWQKAMSRSDDLPDDAKGVFLLIARHAMEKLPCPSDAAIAQVYGTASLTRARRMLAYLEEQGQMVCQQVKGGQRMVTITQLAWETAPGDANAHVAA